MSFLQGKDRYIENVLLYSFKKFLLGNSWGITLLQPQDGIILFFFIFKQEDIARLLLSNESLEVDDQGFLYFKCIK